MRRPERVLPTLRLKMAQLFRLLRQGRIGAVASFFFCGATGIDIYGWYIHRVVLPQSEEGLVKTKVQGSKMWLNLRDGGLSRDLYLYGIREPEATKIFQDELRQLKQEAEGEIVVLEIGANIGYYALQEARILGEKGVIHAFEPGEENVNILRKNVEENGYSITIHHAAIGAEDGSVTLELSSHSNLHKVIGEGEEQRNPDNETIEVDLWSIDGFITEHNMDPEEIRVVRMDVEGHEINIIKGIKRILAADTPLLLFMEVHPEFLSKDQLHEIGEILESNGFKLVAKSQHDVTEGRGSFNIQSPKDLPKLDKAWELIFSR